MNNQKVTQAIVTAQADFVPHQTVEKFALFDENGDPVDFSTPTGDDILLTGLVAGTNTAVLATDTVNEAIAKLQAQIDALP